MGYGPAWVAFGAVVTIASVAMNIIAGDLKMTLFAIAGIICIFYGLNEWRKGKVHHPPHRHQLHRQTNHPQQRPQQDRPNRVDLRVQQAAKAANPAQQTRPPSSFCPSCGAQAQANDKFCRSCGTQLR